MAVLIVPGVLCYALFGATVLYYVAAAAAAFGYEAAMLLTKDGQTLGKKVMNLRVVDAALGNRPADNAYWIRAAIFTLPGAAYLIGGLFSLLNVLWLLWDKPLQQCLHDKAAKTVVVKEA
ncbi:RDD family protein [Streptomyces sp. HNM0645]|uniref:RDD family protein n=1 Tax=Streptomyces sp. HNM0645 TaxID=2782343 RepID=UPI0024B6F805|nr:RDD family protein [Streptomyces sp. HNM0645]MDI9887686.1 RDD family protein [Streptomyces sp. HNM0645]